LSGTLIKSAPPPLDVTFYYSLSAGAPPRPRRGNLQHFPRPIAVFKLPTSKGRGKKSGRRGRRGKRGWINEGRGEVELRDLAHSKMLVCPPMDK